MPTSAERDVRPATGHGSRARRRPVAGPERGLDHPGRLADAEWCCPGIGVAALDDAQAADLAPLFKALGDPVRLRLMSMIAAQPEACVCDLTGEFTLSAPTISHHLKVLREAGLVEAERRGTWVYYRARAGVLGRLGDLLTTGD
jgi:ArsR family transcriptional regulator